MVHKVLLMFVINIHLFTLYGQKDTGKIIYLETLPRLDVINEQIYQVLDSAILYNKDCIYTVRNKPYYFEISLYKKENDTINIHVSSEQYTSVSLFRQLKHIGVFYYKENLVTVRKTSDITSSFFQETSDTVQLYYKDYYPYWGQNIHVYEFMSLVYKYVNNKFILWHQRLCTGASPYYHRVTRVGGIDDTWESIASRYEITVEELKALNKKRSKKTLKLRDMIRVY
jgi:hypothetical protein